MSRKLELNGIINALNKINLPHPTRRYEEFKLAIYLNKYQSLEGGKATVSTITLVADRKEGTRNLSWYVVME